MSIKDAIVATLTAQEEGVRGRTLLQKRIYFLSVLAGEDFGFNPHFYGPYSPEVADQVQTLVEARLISETTERLAMAVNPFGELLRYEYSLTKVGEVAFKRRLPLIKRYDKLLKNINGHPIGNDPYLLSLAAKVHFIVAERGRATVSGIRRRAKSLGWQISKDDIQQVIDYLKHLDLISAR